MTPFWNRMATYGLCEPAPEGAVPPEALLEESERAVARADLDAVVAHDVYRLTRDELGDVLETFPVVKKRDIKAFGDYRTKLLILEAFDRRAGAAAGAGTQSTDGQTDSAVSSSTDPQPESVRGDG